MNLAPIFEVIRREPGGGYSTVVKMNGKELYGVQAIEVADDIAQGGRTMVTIRFLAGRVEQRTDTEVDKR